jgi:DNA helicase-2/ATP-dependent DNA helicase PcrA
VSTRRVNENSIKFQRHERVFHDKFGYGKVVNVSGNKLDIDFDTGGMKCVMDSFVEKA